MIKFFLILNFFFPLILLCLGVIVGGLSERRHIRELAKREDALSHIKLFTYKQPLQSQEVVHLITEAQLVSGSVVIALDYFKRLLAAIRNIFGGEVRSYQSLLMRARREATLRMKERAEHSGATHIYNVRLEFSVIGASRIGGVELFAYGTAVTSSSSLS